MVTNSVFVLWNLIDSQLLACLTASLSQTTLPYVLGFHHSYEVCHSLNNRYNSLSRTHIHELRSKLYSLTKTSTMESYIDTVKTYAQRLAAAGNPLSDDDLVFHTLHGLPPVFNGFKTGIRTSGHTDLTFDELVTMLSGEDIQMTQDPSASIDTNSALIATHPNPNTVPSTSVLPPISQPTPMSLPSVSQTPIPQISPSPISPILPHISSTTSQYPSSSQYFSPSPFYPSSIRPLNRGRGGRGPRYPRDPCAICGKTNHITQYCYYQGQYPFFDQTFSPTYAQN